MTPKKYLDLKEFVIRAGFADEIDWSGDIKKCSDAVDFFMEAAWVIINSGMKNQVAEIIWKRILQAISNREPISSAFKHKGKVKAIIHIKNERERLLSEYLLKNTDKERLDFLASLPWIGKITKYHLAKNLGMDVCKPDRHLVRIAERYKTTPDELCKKLSDIIGDKVTTVDSVIWRAANLGIV